MYSAPAATFCSSRAHFLLPVGLAGVGAAADVEPEGGPDQVAREIAAVVQVVHDPDEADRVDVVDRGRVRVVAELGRIAGDREDVAQAERVGAQQVRLDPQQVPVAAGVVKDGVDADLRLHEHAQRLRAHARRGARAVGHVDRVDLVLLAVRTRVRGCAPGRRPGAGRARPRPRTASPACARAPLFSARGNRRPAPPWAASGPRTSTTSRSGWRIFTERTRFLMWSGVVPQQPPTTDHAGRDEPAGVGGHVLGRAEVDVAALDERGRAGVGHGRDLRGGRRRGHALARSRAWLRALAAVGAHHGDAPAPRGSRTTSSGRLAVGGRALVVEGQAHDQGQARGRPRAPLRAPPWPGRARAWSRAGRGRRRPRQSPSTCSRYADDRVVERRCCRWARAACRSGRSRPATRPGPRPPRAAMRAPSRLILRTCASSPWGPSLKRWAPKVLVSRPRRPRRGSRRGRSRTRSGFERLSSSKQRFRKTPRA